MIDIEGWISLHRKLLDSAVFQNADLLKVWIWCLLKATHKDYEMMVGLQVVELEPGQFVTGRNKGSDELNLKPSTFRDYLKTLEKMGMIELNPDNKKTLITVANWDKYQTESGRVRQQTDNKPTTSRQRADTNNNIITKEHNNKSKKGRTESVLESYNCGDDLKTTLIAFIDMRKQIKASMTDNAIKLMITKLRKMAKTEEEQIMILEQSIMNSYKGVFPIKKHNLDLIKPKSDSAAILAKMMEEQELE